MQSKEERNAYMRDYMKKYRANMNEYTYKKIRERDNHLRRNRYHSMTYEQRQKYIDYQRAYQKQKQFINE